MSSASVLSVWPGYLVVFLGGGCGASLRHFVGRLFMSLGLTGFPLATLFANVTGSLVIGLIAGWLTYRGEFSGGHLVRLGLVTGFLGGYTTFSSFSLDAVLLLERGDGTGAAVYILGNVVPSLIGVFLGLFAMRTLFA